MAGLKAPWELWILKKRGGQETEKLSAFSSEFSIWFVVSWLWVICTLFSLLIPEMWKSIDETVPQQWYMYENPTYGTDWIPSMRGIDVSEISYFWECQKDNWIPSWTRYIFSSLLVNSIYSGLWEIKRSFVLVSIHSIQSIISSFSLRGPISFWRQLSWLSFIAYCHERVCFALQSTTPHTPSLKSLFSTGQVMWKGWGLIPIHTNHQERPQ